MWRRDIGIDTRYKKLLLGLLKKKNLILNIAQINILIAHYNKL